MGQSNIVPLFKKKELNLEYLSDSFEDENRNQFKLLWQTFADFDVNLDLNQLMALMDYSLKSEYYASQLMCLLKEEDFRYYIPSQMEKFRESFSPKSRSERLIFNIFINVCDERHWADEVLKMNEINFDGDE